MVFKCLYVRNWHQLKPLFKSFGAMQHIPSFNLLTKALNTFFSTLFSMPKQRHYYFSKHENRKISQGSHVQGVDGDDPWLPACFPLLWERRIRTLHTGNGLLSPAWQIDLGSLHIFPFSWIFLILKFRWLTTWREMCARSYTFYFGNIMINALQWLIRLFSKTLLILTVQILCPL